MVLDDRFLFRFLSDRVLPRVLGLWYAPLSLKIYFLKYTFSFLVRMFKVYLRKCALYFEKSFIYV